MATFNFKSDQDNDYVVTIDGYRTGTELTPSSNPVSISFVSLAGWDRIYPAAIYRRVELKVISPSVFYYSDLIDSSYDVTITRNGTTIFFGRTQLYSLREAEAIPPYETTIICNEILQYANKRSIDTLDYPNDPITNKPNYTKVLRDVLNTLDINNKYNLNTIQYYDRWLYLNSVGVTTSKTFNRSWLEIYREFSKTFAGTFYVNPSTLSGALESETEFFTHNYGAYSSARSLQQVEQNPSLTYRPPIFRINYNKVPTSDSIVAKLQTDLTDPVLDGASLQGNYIENETTVLKLTYNPGRITEEVVGGGVQTKTLQIRLEAITRTISPTLYYYNFGSSTWSTTSFIQTYTGVNDIIEPREFTIQPFTTVNEFAYRLTLVGTNFGEGISKDIKLYNTTLELKYEAEEQVFSDEIQVSALPSLESFDATIDIQFDNYFEERTYNEGKAESNNILEPVAGDALTEDIFENSLTYFTAQYEGTQTYIDASFLVDETILLQPVIPFNFDYNADGTNELIGLLNGSVSLKTEILRGEFIERKG